MKNTMKNGIVWAGAILLMAAAANAALITITQWTFEGDVLTPSTGSGTAGNVGGTSSAFATGKDGGRGWNTSSYPEQGTASGTAGVEFFASTAGFEDITFSFDHRSSGTASRWSQIEYTVNGGTEWTILTDNGGGLSPHDTFYSFGPFSLPADANDQPGFGVRILSVFSPVAFSDGLGNDFPADEAYHRARVSGGSVYGPGGTWRFDNVTIAGIPEPGTMTLLGLGLGAGALLRRRRRS